MMLAHAFLAVALQAAPAPPAPPAPPMPVPMAPPPPPSSFSTIVREARAKLDAGDFAGAAERYAEALRARPEAAAAAYNQGVALYREGKYGDAARAFSQAAEIASEGTRTDPGVEARSTYNKAASHYRATKAQAEAAERMLESAGATVLDGSQAPAKEPVDPEALKAAIEDAQKSLQGFKDAALNDPTDRDARANAQQSLRLLRALEELRKQQEQQKQDQEQEQKQDQEQQQQQQDQQQSQEQEPKEQQQQKDQQSGDQGEEQPPEDPGDSKDEPKQQPSDGEQDAPKQPADQPPPPKPSGERPGEMTKQEADRLLQAVRDRERERRADQERAAAVPRNRRPPAKDW